MDDAPQPPAQEIPPTRRALDLDWGDVRARLRLRLSPRTYAHCLDVSAQARALASGFGVTPDLTALAGLLHDYAKDLAPEAFVPLAEAAGLEIFEAERDSPSLLHQRLGAHQVAQDLADLVPPDVLSAVARAIACHTTGRADMDALARCVLASDYTAPGRSYPGVARLRAALAQDPEAGFRAVLAFKRELVATRGLPRHPWGEQAYQRWLS